MSLTYDQVVITSYYAEWKTNDDGFNEYTYTQDETYTTGTSNADLLVYSSNPIAPLRTSNTPYTYILAYGYELTKTNGVAITNIQWPANYPINLFFSAGGGLGGTAGSGGGDYEGNGGNGGSGNAFWRTFDANTVKMGENTSTMLYGLTITMYEPGYQFDGTSSPNADTIVFVNSDGDVKNISYGNIFEVGDPSNNPNNATYLPDAIGIGRGQNGGNGQNADNGNSANNAENGSGGNGGYGMAPGTPGALVTGGTGYNPTTGTNIGGPLYNPPFEPTSSEPCAVLINVSTNNGGYSYYRALMPMMVDGCYDYFYNGKYFVQTGNSGIQPPSQSSGNDTTAQSTSTNGAGASPGGFMLFWQQT